MLNRPQVWTLNILAWLVLFPSVTRKALEAFDCVELLAPHTSAPTRHPL